MIMLQFHEILYGPVHSRRLGISLGVNLLPIDAKICTFDCIYCECGFNTTMKEWPMPTREQVCESFETKLKEMSEKNEKLDVITFAGNGEPTLHPQFEAIIDDTIAARNKYYPNAKVSVLTNSTQIHKPRVFRALNKVDNPILKFDSAIDHTMQLMDQPVSSRFNVAWLIEQMKHFEGKLIIQTMFMRGKYKGEIVDNTTEKEVAAWLEVLKEVKPYQIMIYSIDRETPVKTLSKVSVEELNIIAEQARALGFDISVAG